MEVAELESQLGDPDCIVVDCRFNLMDPAAGRTAWKAGHIPGAVYAHLDNDLARPPQAADGRHPLPTPDAFAATLGRLGIASNSTVVVYDDQSGAIAARLWWMLGWIGHTNCYLLNGGLQAWENCEMPLEAGATIRSPVEYEFDAPDDALVISGKEIEAWSASAESGSTDEVLLDARAPARYRGEAEPIDPVAGHVPGARNLPFTELLDGNGKFRSPGELTELFTAVLNTSEMTQSVVAMCGSGVTACHLLAGLAVAGHAGGRLYVGSWSEWINDPSREIASVD